MPGQVTTPARLDAQVKGIRARFGPIQIRNHPVGSPDSQVNFLFRADRILARSPGNDATFEETLRAEVQQELGVSVAISRPDRALVPDLVALTFPNQSAQAIDDMITVLVGRGRALSFDHVVHITSSACCPASDPEPVNGPPLNPVPPVNADATAGQGVRILVIDTGILPPVVNDPAHTWLNTVTGVREPGSVGFYTGHGTFVAGVLRAIAPAAQVFVESIMDREAAISEFDLAPRVIRAINERDPHIICMAAGTRTTNPALVLGFEALRNKLQATGKLLVCAAGNDGTDGPFVPASLGWLEAVSVGALESDEATLAPYSNRGPTGSDWVDVYARGTDVINAFPRNPFTYLIPPRSLDTPPSANFDDGLAIWSGTSFSTPIVAGVIAGRLSRHMTTGETPMQAWQVVKALADSQAQNGRPILKATDAP